MSELICAGIILCNQIETAAKEQRRPFKPLFNQVIQYLSSIEGTSLSKIELIVPVSRRVTIFQAFSEANDCIAMADTIYRKIHSFESPAIETTNLLNEQKKDYFDTAIGISSKLRDLLISIS